ncbi:MAG TPA: hypothetical protein VFR28_12360 [Allosphingosinicella sp.]|jgi:hypothetical protein|nr:hypothetical protein [Allosphingosinicella sp.]
MLPVLAVIFLLQQASYFSARIEDGARTVEDVKIGAWLVLSIILLLALLTKGSWLRSKPVRDLLNDEVTRANRLDGLRAGFVATMAAGIALYLLAMFEPIGGRDAIHFMMTAGIAVALLRFGQLERRAHRGG